MDDSYNHSHKAWQRALRHVDVAGRDDQDRAGRAKMGVKMGVADTSLDSMT
ncbi:hypothetical protein CEB3_c22110 [Peptococcaceae bacterium CEB3]|nr:hypothetical protein CEB3_c22110 [Peptococcaceae bacterium CEB3]